MTELVVRMLQWAERHGTATPSTILLVRAAIRLLDKSAALSEYNLNPEWQPPEPVKLLLAEAEAQQAREATFREADARCVRCGHARRWHKPEGCIGGVNDDCGCSWVAPPPSAESKEEPCCRRCGKELASFTAAFCADCESILEAKANAQLAPSCDTCEGRWAMSVRVCCMRCEGTGSIQGHSMLLTCPVCLGSGAVTVDVERIRAEARAEGRRAALEEAARVVGAWSDEDLKRLRGTPFNVYEGIVAAIRALASAESGGNLHSGGQAQIPDKLSELVSGLDSAAMWLRNLADRAAEATRKRPRGCTCVTEGETCDACSPPAQP